MFSCEFSEISKFTFLTEHLRATASENCSVRDHQSYFNDFNILLKNNKLNGKTDFL